MARSSRSFTLATKAEVEEKKSEYEALEIPFIDPDAPLPKGRKTPEPRYVVAHFPGDGLMLSVIASASGSDDANPAAAVRTFLKKALSPEDFRFVWSEVEASRLDIKDDLMPLVYEMMELWSGVPIQQ